MPKGLQTKSWGASALLSCLLLGSCSSRNSLNTRGSSSSPPSGISQSGSDSVRKVDDAVSKKQLRAAEETIQKAESDAGAALLKDFCMSAVAKMNPDNALLKPNLANLGYFAFLAHLAYRKPAQIGSYLKKLGIDRSEEVTHNSTSAYLWTRGNDLYVVFSGTNDMGDVLTDIDLLFAPTILGSSVHRGFLKAYRGDGRGDEGLRKPLLEALKRHGYPGKKLYFVGHSLGAALAVLAASDLTTQELSPNEPLKNLQCDKLPSTSAAVEGVLTFGMTRVGDFDFAKCYQEKLGSRTLRVVYDRDLFPLMASDKYYRHAGRRIFLSAQGNLEVQPQPQEESPQGMKSFLQDVDKGFIMGNVLDHVSYAVKFSHFLDKSCPSEHSVAKFLPIK